MLPSAVTGTGQAGTLVLHSGYAQAAGAALIALLAIAAVTAFRTRKRIAWEACLDVPVGLSVRQEPGTGTEIVSEILLGEPGRRRPGSATEGWLVLLAISNPGRAPVRSRDFSVPLAFTFPGRQVHATQISPVPAASPAPQPPARQISLEDSPGRVRVQFSGDLLPRRDDGFSVMVLLGGHPASPSRRVEQDGSLAGGRIVAGPGGARGGRWPAWVLCAAALLAGLVLVLLLSLVR